MIGGLDCSPDPVETNAETGMPTRGKDLEQLALQPPGLAGQPCTSESTVSGRRKARSEPPHTSWSRGVSKDYAAKFSQLAKSVQPGLYQFTVAIKPVLQGATAPFSDRLTESVAIPDRLDPWPGVDQS
jgi:hypothetical protein